jgi:predicted RNase H-like HicB family nuclease
VDLRETETVAQAEGNKKMEWYALVEEWPHESLVNFRELPGCLSTAPTAEAALQKAPEAIGEYLRWLKQNQIFFLEDEPTSITVVVKERLRADRVGPRFEADLVAPTDREMANALTVAATARVLLVKLYNEVLPAQRSCAFKPGEWSLTEQLQHILQAEAHYVGCLNDQPPEAMLPLPETELPLKLIENGMSYETFLRGLTAEQRAQVYVHGEAEWTAAKVLRRMTEHLRDHYPWMQTIVRQFCTP